MHIGCLVIPLFSIETGFIINENSFLHLVFCLFLYCYRLQIDCSSSANLLCVVSARFSSEIGFYISVSLDLHRMHLVMDGLFLY